MDSLDSSPAWASSDILQLASQMEPGSVSRETVEKLIEDNKSLSPRIANLIHWVQNPYLNHDSKDFLYRLVSTGVKEDKLVDVEDWLRSTCIGSLRSTACKTSACPTPSETRYSIDEIYASAHAEATPRLKHFDLLIGKRDRLQSQFTKSVSVNLVKRFSKMKGGDEMIESLLGCPANEIDDRFEDYIYTQAAHIIPYRLADYTHKTSLTKMTFWKALYNMFPKLYNIIGPATINSLANGLTISYDHHVLFSEFGFGLQQIEGDKYKVIRFNLSRRQMSFFEEEGGVKIVHFRYAEGTKEDEKVSRDLLHTHLAIAHVINAIGMAEYEEEDPAQKEEENGSHSNPQAAAAAAEHFWTWDLTQRLQRLGRRLSGTGTENAEDK